MAVLKPDWSQDKPTGQDAHKMCRQVELAPFAIEAESISQVLNRLRASHSNGGAFLKAVRIGHSNVFDWFASRKRLLEYEILPLLLHRSEIRDLLPELSIQADFVSQNETDACTFASSSGFKFDNPFLLDGQLAANLFAGGAYSRVAVIDGKTAKRLAMDFCQAIFGQ